ncbi:MAG: hypothetical protein HW378_2323 [Anaerolineales bacterium]|nr:hypothetical protein [Anaerolineales bacterium]
MMGDFYGLPTRTLSNGHLAVEYLAEAGPRIVRLYVTGSDENQLAELPAVKQATPYGDYCMYGGHRLWHAPEAFPRSYIPDTSGLTIEDLPDGVRLCQAAETTTHIAKRLQIRLHADRPALTLIHQLTNEGVWPVECAPWAITQLPLGGMVILPQPVSALDTHRLLPNRQLVLWPYTRWDDARLHLHDEVILIQAEAQLLPCKIGYLNRHGWIGYLRDGVFFRKRFEPQPDLPHPDFGSNAEVYCNDQFVELESLAPLRRLEPGQSTTHIETWEFYTGLDLPPTLEGARSLLNMTDKNEG